MRGSRSTLAVLVLTAVTLVALDVRAGQGSPFDGLRRGSDAVLGRAQGALSGAVDAVLGDRDTGREQELQAEVDRLRAELRRSQGLQRRVDELDALLALGDAGSYPMVPARVLAVGPSFGFAATVTIDAGSRDGLEPGQTVVNGDGLVGRTVRVGPVSTTVLLLTDAGFSVGARLTREGTIGLASGTGQGRLTYALVEAGPVDGVGVEPGDVLLTTGSGTFVPDVPVGRVDAVSADPGELVATAEVTPFVDVGALDLVGVVVALPRSTPRAPVGPAATPTTAPVAPAGPPPAAPAPPVAPAAPPAAPTPPAP